MSRKPLFHILAGPNGAGKSTFYETRIKPVWPNTEFVNADVLAKAHYGHAATTREESETGQRLAEQRRRELMALRRDVATESTFSHPSKLDLLRDAKAAGYDVRVYHVNVRSPELAVKRVARRVHEGGHPVPEAKTRARYERNQPLIREAALLADRAYIIDNSDFGKPHRRVLDLVDGHAVHVSHQVPAWARELYAAEMRGYAPERLNRPAASFAAAQTMATERMGEGTQTLIASGRGAPTYAGAILAETDMHIVQQTAKTTAVAHFKSRLDRVPVVGANCTITYAADGRAKVAAEAADQVQEARAGQSYSGPIRSVAGGAVIQDVDGAAIKHQRGDLYGPNCARLLKPGTSVEISYAKAGRCAQVREAGHNEHKRSR